MLGAIELVQSSVRTESKVLPFIGLSLDIFQGLKLYSKSDPRGQLRRWKNKGEELRFVKIPLFQKVCINE